MIMGSDKVHLAVVGQDPISYGKHGADYRWNRDYSAYRIVPNHWTPGSDSSYAIAQGDSPSSDGILL